MIGQEGYSVGGTTRVWNVTVLGSLVSLRKGTCIGVSLLISLRSLIFEVHLEWRCSASNSLLV
jgi:hypothetical protein